LDGSREVFFELSYGMSPNDLPQIIQRELSSSLTAYHDLVQQILQVLTELNWQQTDLFGVHMALEESISNAIRHGNKEDLTKRVKVECQLSSDRFWAKVCDEGEGYDPTKIPDCCEDDNLEAPGGRGLALIRAYMTSVEHSPCGRCVTMEKKIGD
jgi:serine/threonine-protein kinase RsbW